MEKLKNKKIINTLKLEIYNKGGQTWFGDYYFFNGINYEKGTTKASGYGYDKHSTATSNAINKFKFLYKFKKRFKMGRYRTYHNRKRRQDLRTL